MEVALINDTHFGARGDNVYVMAHQKKFYEEEFFPELERRGIKTIIHLGDIVDRRKYINFLSGELLMWFVAECHYRGIKLIVIVGNHDTFYKNTNRLNAMKVLFGESDHLVEFYEECTEYDLDGLPVMFIPWINPENLKDTMDKIKKTKAEVAFGHLEIKGFEMYKGSPSDHGMESKVFRKFDEVFSGHFHHRSSKGNITYLGAPYEMTWQDWNDPRGFNIFDTDTRKLEHVRSSLHLFHKIIYNEDEVDLEKDYSFIKNSYVKLVVQKRENAQKFDMFITLLEEHSPIELQVVEDFSGELLVEQMMQEDGTWTKIKDIDETIEEFVDAGEFSEREALSKLLQSLYREAMEMD
jgi:DNA repair exonuclease SbcCD nuclease subunit